MTTTTGSATMRMASSRCRVVRELASCRETETMNTTSPQELKAALGALLPEAMHWLRRMVGINSFTANAEGVNWLGALTAECFAPLGFTAELVPSDNAAYGRHVFLSRGDPAARP